MKTSAVQTEEEKLTITKLDAARRQLHTAIVLWFNDGDPISTHTLASAAYEVVHVLLTLAGHQSLLFDSDLVINQCVNKPTSGGVLQGGFLKECGDLF